MRMLLLAVLLLIPVIAAAQDCGVNSPCAVAGGTYRASPPAGPPRGAALFLHGYGDSADGMMQDDDLRAAFRAAGLLLVLPNGANKSWHIIGRDDRAFIEAVADDAARRWHVERRAMWLGGFSVGASEVWDLACDGAGFASYVAISGQFWDRLPQHCDGPPINLLQIHGLTDDVFPLEGRAIGPGHQGDLFASLAVLRDHDGCRSNPDEMTARDTFVLRLWTSCRSGARLGMILHTGGHEMPAGWFPLAYDWMRTLSAP